MSPNLVHMDEEVVIAGPKELAHRPIKWWLAALFGVVSVALALGVSELATGLSGGDQSLIGALGAWVIDAVPSTMAKWAIEVFGTYDKVALVVSIVAVALLIGAIVGMATRRTFVIAVAGFVAFGVVAFVAASADPLSDRTAAAVASIAAVVVGLLAMAMFFLTGTKDREPDAARRTFLRSAGAVSALALASAMTGRWAIARMATAVRRDASVLPIVDAAERVAPPSPAAQVVGAVDVVTPNSEFYKIDTAVTSPLVNPDNWSLKISGMVDRPFEMTYDELLELPMVERYVTLSCVSNKVGGGLVGNAKWTGVPLSHVLDLARVQDGATQIVGRSVDDFTVGFPTDIAFDGRDALIAVGMNGEPLPVDNGYPARLVVAGLYGYVSATKWLSEIELTTWDAFDAYWVPRGWAKEGPIKTQSRIDRPSFNQRVPAGEETIAGVAWAPSRGISKVEVSIDEGPWLEAELAESLSDNSWRQWKFPWQATEGNHRVSVRATDGTGATQTELEAPPRPDGASGWHTISVIVES